MKRLVIFVFGIICFQNLVSQDFVQPEFLQLWRDFEQKNIKTGKEFVNYNGTPYLFESDDASLILESGQEISGITIRYNAFEDQMEVKKGDNFYVIPKERIIPKYLLDGHKFYLRIYKVGGKRMNGYFDCLVDDGYYKLYIQHNVVLQEAEETRGYVEAKPPKFIHNPPKVFLSVGEEVLIIIKNKQDFLENTTSHEDAVKHFIKKNKTKFRKPESISDLVEYYNSLL